jgi:cell wall-associated NlpC family hydrolase
VDVIIAIGMKQLGTSYVFGGDTPGVAFDCSGFVQYVFNQNGFNFEIIRIFKQVRWEQEM